MRNKNQRGQSQKKGCGSANGLYSRNEIIKILPRHQNCTPNLIKKLQNASQSELENKASRFAQQINSMIKDIYRERERSRQFTRTRLNKYGVMYAEVSAHHQIEDMILEFFHERFPAFVIVVFNVVNKKSYAINEYGKFWFVQKPLKEVITDLSKNRSVVPFLEDMDIENDELMTKSFQTFYKSQFIEQRENRRYFKHMIPDNCMALPGMKGGVEKRFRNNSLDSWLN
jgi:uncharacterized membrane protein YheB (UPF0754 family)